jgi:hypothetical protein
VRTLIERLQYRSRSLAIERIATRTYHKVEDLYNRSESEYDPEVRLNMEKAALSASTAILSMEERRAAAEARRREQRAYQATLAMSRENLRNETAPPTLDEAKHTILMLRDLFGADVLREMISAALPMGEDTETETFDADPSPS